MPSLAPVFGELTTALTERYGGPVAGSGDDGDFERMVRVLSSRSLGAKKGERVFHCLRNADLLEPERLAEIDLIELADIVECGGSPVTRACLSTLKRLAQWMVEKEGDGSRVLAGSVRSAADLREELAQVRGIGIAGADALLLHGLERPTYAVDRSSLRILIRHGWADISTSNEEARELLTGLALELAEGDETAQTRILSGIARGMSQVGRQHCRAAAPRCTGCALESLLPDGGPLQIES